jgi:hypothetical protein
MTCGGVGYSFLTERAQRREYLDLKPLLEVMWRPEASFEVKFVFPNSASHRKLTNKGYYNPHGGVLTEKDFQPETLNEMLRSLVNDELNIKQNLPLIAHIAVNINNKHGIVFYKHAKHQDPCEETALNHTKGSKLHTCSLYKQIFTWDWTGKVHIARVKPEIQELPQSIQDRIYTLALSSPIGHGVVVDLNSGILKNKPGLLSVNRHFREPQDDFLVERLHSTHHIHLITSVRGDHQESMSFLRRRRAKQPSSQRQ